MRKLAIKKLLNLVYKIIVFSIMNDNVDVSTNNNNNTNSNNIDSNKINQNDEFTNIADIIKRDIPTNNEQNKNETDKTNQMRPVYKIYQIQSEKNSTTANLFYLGKCNDIPIKNILSFCHPRFKDIKCDMISHTITKDEVNRSGIINQVNNGTCQYLKLIGFLICFDQNIIASLDFVFNPTKNILVRKSSINPINKNIESINGTFKIILCQKQNGEYKETIIKEYNSYCGREESIYILTSVLLEENVIEKYIRKEN